MPRCQCVVCLYDFSPGDVFTKTACYHYFHSHCLRGHALSAERHWREEQERLPQWQRRAAGSFPGPHCPVCRDPLTIDMDLLSDAPPPRELEMQRGFEVTAELRALQVRYYFIHVHIHMYILELKFYAPRCSGFPGSSQFLDDSL